MGCGNRAALDAGRWHPRVADGASCWKACLALCTKRILYFMAASKLAKPMSATTPARREVPEGLVVSHMDTGDAHSIKALLLDLAQPVGGARLGRGGTV